MTKAMDVKRLKEFVALYLYALDEEADRTARQADYQDGTPLEVAQDMRHDAKVASGHLKRFIGWVDAKGE